jgi:hypothetical protein
MHGSIKDIPSAAREPYCHDAVGIDHGNVKGRRFIVADEAQKNLGL